MIKERDRPVICTECKQETDRTCNGMCLDCWKVASTAWQERMAIRMDASKFDAHRLVCLLLTQHWMHECKIIPDYMPPFPREDTRPTCQVHYVYKDGSDTGLRYSKGPLQGYTWDIYGDDFHSPELALIALSQAPAPPRIDVVILTHGR
jgi:hypothetical protein